jgi:putative ATP-dependent endonuclease of OLD family
MARITRLTIKGYRSVRDEIAITFPQNMPVVLVGENNGGKSNIVRALNLMLGQFSPAYHEERFVRVAKAAHNRWKMAC